MRNKWFLLLLLLPGLGACSKSPDTGVLSTNFVVQTSRNQSSNFQSYKTYYIPDTIKLRNTNPLDTLWFDANAKQLIATVKSNMAARGYTLVSKGSKPDLGVSFTAIKDLNVGVVYPGWWWGYWGCYWGWCYYPPYYPSTGYVYTVPTGTLVLDMVDLKNAVTNNNLTVTWNSVMSGGLGYTANDIQLGIDAINQSFTQSAYLKTN